MKKLCLSLVALFAFVLVVPSTANAAGPTVLSAVVTSWNGKTITATFDDLTGSQPLQTDFTVVGSVQGNVGISVVFRSGKTITVLTSAVVLGGQTATLTYAPTTNVPTNSVGEPLAGFTITLSNPGATVIPMFYGGFQFNVARPSQINVELWDDVTCALTSANFSVTVNGSNRQVSSVTENCNAGSIVLNLSSPILANDRVSASYIPSSRSIETIFGTQANAVTNAAVAGVPDTLAPVLTVPSISSYQLGQGGTISLVANEIVYWGIATDRTLSFQLGPNDEINPVQLLVSSILPAGTYSVGLSAEDRSGNTSTANITIVINSSAGSTPIQNPSPSVTPRPSSTPSPSASPPVAVKPVTYKNCAALNKKHLGGVALNFGVKNKGKGMTYIARVDALTYAANFKLDIDKDGITCER